MGEYVYASVRKIYFIELFSLSCLQIAFPQIILDYLRFTIKTVTIVYFHLIRKHIIV